MEPYIVKYYYLILLSSIYWPKHENNNRFIYIWYLNLIFNIYWLIPIILALDKYFVSQTQTNSLSFQFDRKLSLAPGLVVPSNLDYQGYHAYIDEMLPHESPVHYGLHPNAEIEFLTVTSDSLFHTLLELQYTTIYWDQIGYRPLLLLLFFY